MAGAEPVQDCFIVDHTGPIQQRPDTFGKCLAATSDMQREKGADKSASMGRPMEAPRTGRSSRSFGQMRCT